MSHRTRAEPRANRGAGLALAGVPRHSCAVWSRGRMEDVGVNRIDCGSCLELLPRLPAGCADLCFADPPFNIGFEYDQYSDRMERTAYLLFAKSWVAECVRVLSPTGSFFLAIGDEYAAEYKLILHDAGLHCRNWIVWHYTFGPHQKKKFGRDHAHILYFVRHPERLTFNADDIRVESERQRAGDKRANPKGRVPGDVWQEEPPTDGFAEAVWTVPRLVGNAKERTGHPCQMPESILERIIRAASNPGDLVIDPFCGSGTTPAVAHRLGRRWYSCDVSAAYVERAQQRVALVRETAA